MSDPISFSAPESDPVVTEVKAEQPQQPEPVAVKPVKSAPKAPPADKYRPYRLGK